MRTSVATFLEQRLCPREVVLEGVAVPGDALAMLRAGMIDAVVVRDGLVFGEVPLRAALAAAALEAAGMRWGEPAAEGMVALVRCWLERGGRPGSEAVRRALDGTPLSAAELEGVSYSDRSLILLAYRATGAAAANGAARLLPPEGAEGEEQNSASLALLRDLVRDPRTPCWPPLWDLPPSPVSVDDPLEVSTFVYSGDLSGCVAQLEARIARANARGAAELPSADWPAIAEVSLLLHGDEAAAMGYLERACFADSLDAWRRLFGARGTARVLAEKAAVLAAIEEAFEGIPFPGPEHRSLYQAEAADSYDTCDQSLDHKGRWQDLPREQILECQWALPYLGAQSLRYYLPALMSFATREAGEPRDDHASGWIFHSLACFLVFEVHDDAMRLHFQERCRLFSPAQLAAIARFAEFYRPIPAELARWRALAAGGAWPALEQAG